MRRRQRPWAVRLVLAISILGAALLGAAACTRARLVTATAPPTAQPVVAPASPPAQENTQWSVVYNRSTGESEVVVGRNYRVLHTFELEKE